MKHRVWLFVLSGFFFGTGCGGNPEPPKPGKERVVLRLNWYPEVEHGGFYAALVQGDFAAEGLDVEIQPGGPGTPVIPEVALGRAEFGVESADKLLVGRSQETPVVTLLAPLQRSPVCIMAHRASGFKSLRDLRDVTLAITLGSPFANYLKKNVPLEGVRMVPYEGGIALFLRDPKFAQQGYVFSEPLLAESQGGDPVALAMADIGYNPYGSILIAGESLIRTKPELVAKMVRACRRGWRRYVEDPSPANAQLAKLNTLIPLDVVTKMSAALRPLILADLKGLDEVGSMTPKRWADLLGQLEGSGVIKPGKIRSDDAFNLSFLETESSATLPAPAKASAPDVKSGSPQPAAAPEPDERTISIDALLSGVLISGCVDRGTFAVMDPTSPNGSAFELVDVATETDLDGARQLFLAYAAEFADLLFETLRFQRYDAEIASLPGRYTPPSGCLLLARHGDQPAGCVGLRDLGDGTCEMKRLYVDPAYRGRDLGKLLIEAVLHRARSTGYRRMVLDTRPEMGGALALYRAFGFVEIPAYWDNPIEPTIYFEKILAHGKL